MFIWTVSHAKGRCFGNVPGRCCLELLLLVIQWCLVHSGRISPTQIVMLVLLLAQHCAAVVNRSDPCCPEMEFLLRLELPVYTINKAETVGRWLAPVWAWELTVAIGTGWPCFRQFGQSLSQNSNGPLRLPVAGIHFVSVSCVGRPTTTFSVVSFVVAVSLPLALRAKNLHDNLGLGNTILMTFGKQPVERFKTLEVFLIHQFDTWQMWRPRTFSPTKKVKMGLVRKHGPQK